MSDERLDPRIEELANLSDPTVCALAEYLHGVTTKLLRWLGRRDQCVEFKLLNKFELAAYKYAARELVRNPPAWVREAIASGTFSARHPGPSVG